MGLARVAFELWDAHLRFDPSDEVLRLNLANSLYLQAIDSPPGRRTRAQLLECEELLESLARSEPSSQIDELLAEVTAELTR